MHSQTEPYAKQWSKRAFKDKIKDREYLESKRLVNHKANIW